MNHARKASVAGSAYSATGSTHHLLEDMNLSSSSDYGGLLNPPRPPFSANNFRSSRDNLSLNSATSSSNNLSLTINYLPAKFSTAPISPMGGGARQRRSKKAQMDDINLPKRGGGTDAFKTGEARMPGKRLRWNRFKWILFCTNSCLTVYSLGAIVVSLLTWFDVWPHSNVVRIANRTELILSTIAAGVGLLASVIGWAGILLNNRSFLAVYTLLTWVTFGFLVAPGYVTYRRHRLNLDGKINAQWSRAFDSADRLIVQNELKCCGYFSPFVEATISQTCYARSVLPGCKLPYLEFQRVVLKRFYTVAFALVPLQLAVMIAALLCSNHITYRFGKGLMPEAYRLNAGTMAVIAENYANQLAEQYGAEVAANVYRQSMSSIRSQDSNRGLLSTVNPFGTSRSQRMSPFQGNSSGIRR